MSNEQLLILIRAWANRLEREIELINDELPDEMERIPNQVYIGKNPISFWDKDPKNWKEEPGDFVITLGISGLLIELRDAEETLKGESAG